MRASGRLAGRCLLIAVAACAGLSSGCLCVPSVETTYADPTLHKDAGTAFAAPPSNDTLPRELAKVTMPEYTIEPPGILRIELLRVIPPPGKKVAPSDILFLQINYPGQTEPFAGETQVGPDGRINMDSNHGGVVKVSGLTIEEVRDAVKKQAAAEPLVQTTREKKFEPPAPQPNPSMSGRFATPSTTVIRTEKDLVPVPHPASVVGRTAPKNEKGFASLRPEPAAVEPPTHAMPVKTEAASTRPRTPVVDPGIRQIRGDDEVMRPDWPKLPAAKK